MKKAILYLTVLVLAFAQAAIAQESKTDMAKVYKNMGDYDKAIELYTQSDENLDEFQYCELGELYLITGQSKEAIEIFSKLIDSYPDFQKAYLPLATALRKHGDNAQAMKYYEVYGNFDPYVSNHYVEMMRWAEETKGAAGEWAGRSALNLNTRNFEGFPTSYKDKTVYTSNRRDIKRPTVANDIAATQLFTTYPSKSGQYTFPSFLLKDLQPWQGIAHISMHPSSDEVIFTRISQPDMLRELLGDTNGMSLYIAELVNGELVNMRSLPFNSIKHNTAGAIYGKDGNTIYFMSNKSGGYGGYDIYTATRNADGEWGDAVNLGSEVNTPGDEIFPQLIDGQLFFASDWHMGYGGFDIMQATFDESKTQWSDITNLGYGINTELDELSVNKIDDEFFLTAVDAEGSTGIFKLDNFTATTAEPQLVSTSYETQLLEKTDYSSAFANEEKKLIESIINKENRHVPLMVDIDKTLNMEELHELGADPILKTQKVYSVQVAILEHGSKEQLEYYGNKFSDIDAVYKIYFPDNIKIRIGSYKYKEDASQTLKAVRERGFRDAFIVEEEIMYSSSDPSITSTKTSTSTLNKTADAPASTETQVSSRIDALSQVNILPLGEGEYKIRLAAYTEPKWFTASKVEGLGNIQRVNKDNWAIYMIGDYNTLEEAEFMREKAISNGFNNAEIVKYDGEFHRVK